MWYARGLALGSVCILLQHLYSHQSKDAFAKIPSKSCVYSNSWRTWEAPAIVVVTCAQPLGISMSTLGISTSTLDICTLILAIGTWTPEIGIHHMVQPPGPP